MPFLETLTSTQTIALAFMAGVVAAALLFELGRHIALPLGRV